MNIKKFLSLKEYNTFNIDVKSVYSFFCYDEKELIKFLESETAKENPYLILGGGSNILFSEDYNGIVIIMKTKGVEITHQNNDFIFVKASAGEVWDEFVDYCVDNNYGGIENLSLIPGTVGASPIQNIGAYGVEVKDTFYELEALNRKSLKVEIFNKKDCNFAYRDSIFKNVLKDQYIILSVTFRLSKKHKLKLDYGTIKNELADKTNLSIKEVRQAIIRIRERKLPDPIEFPNSGSFFKNPIVNIDFFQKLLLKFPQLISYPSKNGNVKLAAGQLIDLCNWKGKRENGVGVHDNQALVIVNYENANGSDILEFSEKIQASVLDKFDVQIEREVTLIN